jgi:SAM-dependent methyltransferase
MDQETVLRELQAYGAASASLNTWVAGAQAIALLRAALTSGIFEAARTARTPAEIGAITGVEECRVADICAALDAHGVFARADGRYRLSADFATLSAPGGLKRLPLLVNLRLVEARTLEAAAAPVRPYTSLPGEELLAIADGVTGDAASPLYHAYLRGWFAERAPELHALMEAGCRHAEFGCGIGGFLLGLLLAYPRLSGVGMEINAQVIAETRRRAVRLGVDDRVELRHTDVRDVGDEEAFDTAFWSQGFFPTGSRAAVPAVILRALKPGGYLLYPGAEAGEPPETDEALHGPQGRAHALSRLIYSRWGVPSPPAGELREEMVAAGFTFVRFVPFGPWEWLVLRRPFS